MRMTGPAPYKFVTREGIERLFPSASEGVKMVFFRILAERDAYREVAVKLNRLKDIGFHGAKEAATLKERNLFVDAEVARILEGKE